MGHLLRTAARLLLAAFLGFAGLSHLFWARETFQAQVPEWLPLGADFVVIASGVVEVALAIALLVPTVRRPLVGWIVAAFFVAVFPGNVSQYLEGADAFGLDSEVARLTRLFFQPLLIAWALWCTGAWAWWVNGRRDRDPRAPRASGPADAPDRPAPRP